MKDGTMVKIERIGNSHAKHFVGRIGVVVGPRGPLDTIVVKLDAGEEIWVRECNLSVVADLEFQKSRTLDAHQANHIIQKAKDLGVKLTNAEFGTEMYRCWADRVMDAAVAVNRRDWDRVAEMVKSANEYAI